MSIIKSTEPLYRYKGRIFVVLCGCNDPKGLRFRHSIVGRRDNCKVEPFSHACSKCGMYHWIILPEGETRLGDALITAPDEGTIYGK